MASSVTQNSNSDNGGIKYVGQFSNGSSWKAFYDACKAEEFTMLVFNNTLTAPGSTQQHQSSNLVLQSFLDYMDTNTASYDGVICIYFPNCTSYIAVSRDPGTTATNGTLQLSPSRGSAGLLKVYGIK